MIRQQLRSGPVEFFVRTSFFMPVASLRHLSSMFPQVFVGRHTSFALPRRTQWRFSFSAIPYVHINKSMYVNQRVRFSPHLCVDDGELGQQLFSEAAPQGGHLVERA